MNIKVISKGSRKAQVVIHPEGGGTQTVHLRLKGGKWVDRKGNVYTLEG